MKSSAYWVIGSDPETSNLFLCRLGHRVRALEQEDRDLFVGLLADIYSPMNTVRWLLPVNLSRRNLDATALSSIPVLDQEHIPAQHDRYAMK
jgi:hypothetical protein